MGVGLAEIFYILGCFMIQYRHGKSEDGYYYLGGRGIYRAR